MTEGGVRESVVTAKAEVVRESLDHIRTLPLDSLETFLADHRTPGSGENYLRRTLEALLDLGRHILAKGFGTAASEYKQIPIKLREKGVIAAPVAETIAFTHAGFNADVDHDVAVPRERTGRVAGGVGQNRMKRLVRPQVRFDIRLFVLQDRLLLLQPLD